MHLPSGLYEGLHSHADRRQLTVADVLRAAASRHLAYLAVLEDPTVPCDHGNPRGCTACALCRRGASDPGGHVCRLCLRGWSITGRATGPIWHQHPTPPVQGAVPLEQWSALRARAEQQCRPVDAVVGTAIEHYLQEPTP